MTAIYPLAKGSKWKGRLGLRPRSPFPVSTYIVEIRSTFKINKFFMSVFGVFDFLKVRYVLHRSGQMLYKHFNTLFFRQLTRQPLLGTCTWYGRLFA